MVGTLVIDELHLVGDSSRGYLLEVFVSKAGDAVFLNGNVVGAKNLKEVSVVPLLRL